jgi:hypothetical protein
VAVVAIGLVVGYGTFALTAQESYSALMPPECRLVTAPGFDLFTGLPHGMTIECAQLTGLGGQLPVAQASPTPPDLAGRRAVPVPLGFAAGVVLAVGVLAVRRVRQASNDRESARSAMRT